MLASLLARFHSQKPKKQPPQAKPPTVQSNRTTQTSSAMAYQLLEIVEGELTVAYEYGAHETLNTGDASWLTIRKADASVCLSLTSLRAIVDEEYDATVRKDTTLDMSYSYDNGELRIANSEAVFKSPPAEPTRHVVVLSLTEQRSLASMEPVLRAFGRMFAHGGLRIGAPDGSGSVRRKHVLTARQPFHFLGALHCCEFMPAGALVLEPFAAVNVECDCGAHSASAKAWADKARLRLTRRDADTLLEFNETELAAGDVPRAGRVLRLNDERAVGVWPTEAYFPGADVEGGDKAEQAKAKKANASCALVPFTATEWRWFVACLRLYLATGDYLLRRERAAAAMAAKQQEMLAQFAPGATGNETGAEKLRRAAAKHKAELRAADAAPATETDV